MASRGKGSKRKGNKYETRCRKIIGKWYYDREDALVRTPQSGGGHWEGDIVENPNLDIPKFPACIECKNAEKWSFNQLLTAPECSLYKWLHQTIKQATKVGKIPMLMVSKNYDADYVGLPLSYLSNIKKYEFLLIVKKQNFEFFFIALTDLIKHKPNKIFGK